MREIDIPDIIIDEPIYLGDVELDVVNVGENVKINLQSKIVTPSMGMQIITPDSGFDALDVVTVLGATSDIDEDIKPENIRKDKNILGVNGTLIELNGEETTINPTTTEQTIVPSEGKNAITKVIVRAVTSDIDDNIQPNNIKSGVTILGVVGNLIEGASDENKLALMLGPQDPINNPYEIFTSDIGNSSTIPQYLFYGKNGLVNVELPNVTSIGVEAFRNCENLKSVNIANVTSISGNAFQNCKSLDTLNVSSVKTLGSYAFAYCESITQMNIPYAETIASYALYNCDALETLNIPNVTSVGYYAVSGCIYLTSVNFQKLERIDRYAFQYCYRLSNVTIPASCGSLGAGAFGSVGSQSKKEVCDYKFLGATPPTVYANTFTSNRIGKIVVPPGCGEIYKSATNWASFADYIEEEAV